MSIHQTTVRGIAGLQWFVFMFTNTVVIPISVGGAFHLGPHAVSGVMARAFILTGFACLVQGLFGHRLPLMEGQSGLWWGVILGLAAIGSGSPGDLAQIGGNLAFGMIAGGLLVAVLGVFGLHRWLNQLFTPVVMAVLLMLLSSQLVEIFFRGMLGLNSGTTIRPGVAMLAIAISLFVGALTLFGRGLLSNFAILSGLILGWIAYAILFRTQLSTITFPDLHDVTTTFVYGTLPGFGTAWHPGLIITAMFTAVLNITNTTATLRAAEPVFSTAVSPAQYRRSLVLSGLLTSAAGIFGQVPYAPYTSSIGFLRTTRILDRVPYLIGAAVFMVFGFIPALSGFFAALPYPVGAAVLLIAYLQLFGAALQNLEGMDWNFRTIYRIAFPVLIGLSLQTTGSQAFATIGPLIRPLVSNGMIVGILIAIVLENLLPWKKWAGSADAVPPSVKDV